MNNIRRCLTQIVRSRPIFQQSQMFIRTIPKVVSEHAHDKEIEQLFTKVNQLTQNSDKNRLFAVIQLGNEQRKVTTEDIICKVDEFHPTIGDRIRFEKVLLVGSSDFTVVGRPLLSPHFVRVEGIVIEKTLSQTQMDYWYAPKRKKVGARQHLWRDPMTMIRITNIEILGPIPGTSRSNS